MNRKRTTARLAGFLALLLAAGLLMLVGLSILISERYKAFTGSEVFVSIPKGASVPVIGRILHSAGVIRSPRLFTLYVRLVHPTSSVKAGEYRFEGPVSLREVVRKLLRGEIYVVRITIPEGLSRRDVIDLLVKQGIADKASLEQATQDTRPISHLDQVATDLEGYLFPDTFFFSKSTTADEAVRAMASKFLGIWTPGRQRRASELNMSVREVLTLASIVEKETGNPSERPLVSAVFHNRLQLNIPLGSDPTVVYGVKLIKNYDGVINQSDLKLDSAYNTYLHYGLPPGPIANPGLASIDAALHPADVKYLYFVSKNDGSHFFSVDYAEHVRAVHKYQR